MKINQMYNSTRKESFNLNDIIKFENNNLSGTGRIVKFGKSTTWIIGIEVKQTQTGKSIKLSNNICLMNKDIQGLA